MKPEQCILIFFEFFYYIFKILLGMQQPKSGRNGTQNEFFFQYFVLSRLSFVRNEARMIFS